MIFVKELEKYNINYLKSIFLNDSYIIEYLISKKIIIKYDSGFYSFDYVGILLYKDKVIFSLPKYTQKSNYKDKAVKLLQLFGQYTKREKLEEEELETFGAIDSTTSYNMLSTIIFILNDYIENGVYTNEKSVYELNGNSEINWQKTIDDVMPILSNGNVLYLDYYTDTYITDDENYFMQLHKYIINECTKKLDSYGLIEYFGFSRFEFDVDENTLGSPNYITTRLNNELFIQFVSRKQILLKAMISLINNVIINSDNNFVSFYGTRSFNLVWEKTCGYVLNNKYSLLRKLISNPIWTLEGVIEYKAPTLKPDILCVTHNTFAILDAKYYKLEIKNDTIVGHPGVEDVTKQYLYQLTFEAFIRKFNFSNVKNVFLLPTEKNSLSQIGTVRIDFLRSLTLRDILLFEVPAEIIFEMYSKGKKISIDSFLNLSIETIE